MANNTSQNGSPQNNHLPLIAFSWQQNDNVTIYAIHMIRQIIPGITGGTLMKHGSTIRSSKHSWELKMASFFFGTQQI
jgi:hypothetical protein